MQQLELFSSNIEQSLVKKIKYWRNKIRIDEKNIYRREKNKRQTQIKLSLLRLKNDKGTDSLSSYREKKRLSKIIELQEKLLSITYELYFDSLIQLNNLYYKLNLKLRLVS